jgi:hypothetical protein
MLLCGIGGLLLGAVLAGAIVFYLHHTHRLGLDGQRQVEAFSDVGERRAGELAERFRPLLMFDSGERWRPLNVNVLLDEGRHRYCTRAKGPDRCTPIAGASAFAHDIAGALALGQTAYLDIAGGSVPDYRGPERCPPPLQDCGTGPRSAIYYHVTQSNDRFYVDYWWFLRFNHVPRSLPGVSCLSAAARATSVCGEHEGDWEGVTVVTPPDDDRHIDYVVYAAHKGTFRYSDSLLQPRSGTRRYVYVAQGTHASYPAPCDSDCSEPPGLAVDGLVDLPESRFDGKAPWARNGEACRANTHGSCLLSLTAKEQPWTIWPGQWGAGCGDACGGSAFANSPPSPGVQERYQTPWCSTQNGVITCDSRALRCGDWLGPLVVAVACDPALLSRGLRANDKLAPGSLTIALRGKPSSQATTPGVVQRLGDPLRPGERLTVTADGPRTEVLVRAQQGSVTVEDRFDHLAAAARQRIAVTVARGTHVPTVRANGHAPVEERIVESER